jgi:Bacterial Ig domain
VFHHLCDGCSTSSVPEAEFAAFLDWLTAQPDVEVQTVREAMGMPDPLPAVAGPAPAPRSPAQLLSNPGFETDANLDGLSDCWARSSAGDNSATWTRAAPAHAGAGSEQVTVSSYVSGYRKLVVRQDLGQCAPAATPGHTYTFTGSYVATGGAKVKIVAYYRKPNGSWVTWASAPGYLAQSAAWAPFTWTTPPLPADARGVSVGLGVYSAGTLRVDDAVLARNADTVAPTVSVTYPAAGATVTGRVRIAASASDAVGVARVRFFLDGLFLGSRTTGGWFRWWESATVAPGLHTITAQALDQAGNSTTSAPVVVTVAAQ